MRSIEGYRQFKSVGGATPPTGHGLEIVGMQSIITSSSSLETRLGLQLGEVSFFQIIGNTIYATVSPYVGTTYDIPANAFLNETSLYSYRDMNNSCDFIDVQAFKGCTGANNFTFNGVLTIMNGAFDGCTQAESGVFQSATQVYSAAFNNWLGADVIDLRACGNTGGQLGGSINDDQVFQTINATATVHLADGVQGVKGNPADGDYTYIFNRGCNVIIV